MFKKPFLYVFLLITLFLNFNCDGFDIFNYASCLSNGKVGEIQNQELKVQKACWGHLGFDINAECTELHTLLSDYGKKDESGSQECEWSYLKSLSDHPDNVSYANVSIEEGFTSDNNIFYNDAKIDTTSSTGNCCYLFCEGLTEDNTCYAHLLNEDGSYGILNRDGSMSIYSASIPVESVDTN